MQESVHEKHNTGKALTKGHFQNPGLLMHALHSTCLQLPLLCNSIHLDTYDVSVSTHVCVCVCYN